jgi:Tol biopolymer transport system component
MLIVRVLTAAAKPALVGGALSVAAVGGYFFVNRATSHQPTPFESVAEHGHRLIISEFGDRSDNIVAVDPDHVGDRDTIATIDHAPGYGVFPVLSPDGSAIAYTALPSDAANPSPDTPALAGIVDTHGDVMSLATDIDLLVPPVWTPDSDAIVVRKNTPQPNSAGTFELLLLARDGSRSTITSWSTAALFPIAFSPDGSKLYFATLNSAGSDLYSIAPNGSGETKIAHLSDEVARDWKLSPDGSALAYSVAESGPNPSIVTKVLDLASEQATDAVSSGGADDSREEFNPAWRGDGELTIASLNPQGGGNAVDVGRTGAMQNLTTNAASIDLPLGWSPDGGKLVVRAVEGANPDQAGASHLELVAPNGDRTRVSDSADVLVVGWLP